MSFEAEINKSDELAAEVEQLKGLEKELKTISVHEFQDKINGWEQDYRSAQSTKTVQWSNSNWYAVAASVVLLVTAGYFFLLTQSTSPEQLFISYYEPYPDMVLVRGGDNLDRDILEGITAYNNKDYQKASIDLQSALNKDPENYMVALYLAISQIEIKKFESSIKNLAIAQTNPLLKDQANGILHLFI